MDKPALMSCSKAQRSGQAKHVKNYAKLGEGISEIKKAKCVLTVLLEYCTDCSIRVSLLL